MARSAGRGRSVLVRAGLLLGVAGVTGAALAVAALPFVGGAGLLAKSQADRFLAMPASLERAPLPTRSRILAADGSVLATLYFENRLEATLAEIPPHAVDALLAIEDARFYDHDGIDVKGTLRAFVTNTRSGRVEQGGSTLTQQYVKNALLTQARDDTEQDAATEQSVDRKLREARLALSIEKAMDKDAILQAYFNIAYYGNGVYGIKTAASHYFGKRLQDLTVAEGALLAGMVQNPSRFDPTSKRPGARADVLARRALVLRRMLAEGSVDAATAARAEQEPLRLKVTKVTSGCEAPGVRAPFFCDYVRRVLEEDTPLGRVLGRTRAERQSRLLGGGLTIRTTLDPKVQRAAQRAVDEQVPRNDPSGVVAVADVVEPSTGHVKAMAVNRTFAEGTGSRTKLNYAVGGSLGFQGGSTFKAFVLAEALRQGIPLGLRMSSPVCYAPRAFPYLDEDGKAKRVCNAGDSEAGVFTLRTGTHLSVNTYYIQLEERTGLVKPPELAEQLGVRAIVGGEPTGDLLRGGAFVLGADSVSPLAMAGAYGAFANSGTFCPPTVVTGVDVNGKRLALPRSGCENVLDQAVADTVTAVLRGVVEGPGPRTGGAAAFGRPVAGKTGTAQSSKAAWFVGYTPQLSAAVWVGKPTPTPLERVRINGTYYRAVYGGTIPARIFSQLMGEAHAGLPVERFPVPKPLPRGKGYDDARWDEDGGLARNRAASPAAGPAATASASSAPQPQSPPPPPPPPPPPGNGNGNGNGGNGNGNGGGNGGGDGGGDGDAPPGPTPTATP